ncbi:MAG: hypothetical protein AB4290_00145 [Spirulina sp.]
MTPEQEQIKGVCRVWGCPVTVEALRLEDGQFLVVISPDATEGLVKDYALRDILRTLLSMNNYQRTTIDSQP